MPDDATGRKPTLWIVLACVFALAAIGLGIWALTLNSDLDDSQATVEQQSAQLASQQETGSGLVAKARAAFGDLSDELTSTQQDTAALQQQLDQAVADLGQAKEDAQSAVADAGRQADARMQELEASANAAKACAQSAIGAFGAVFDADTLQAGVDQAVADLQAIESPCQSVLD